MSSECEVVFKIVVHTQFNESVRLVGDIMEFGMWDPYNGFELTTNSQKYPVWYNKSKLMIKKGQHFNYKLVVFNGGAVSRWEELPQGNNRSYRVNYQKVLLEGQEGIVSSKEVILVDSFSANDDDMSPAFRDLEGMRNPRRKILNDKDFNPFRLAESEESSEDLNFSREFSSELSPNLFSPHMDQQVFFTRPTMVGDRPPSLQQYISNASTQDLAHYNEDDDDRISAIYEQFLRIKSNNRMFQPYSNFSHHESVFSYNEENMKIFNSEKISQLVIVSLAIPFSIHINEDSKATSTLFGRYSRIRFEEDKKSSAWNLYNVLKAKLGSKLLWFGCVFDSYPLAIREDARDSLTHSYNVVPMFVEDPSYNVIQNDYRKITSYNEFKDGELEDSWSRLESFNQRLSQFISHHCHPDATVIILHKEMMLLPQLLTQLMSKLNMSFYWDACFPSRLYRTKSLYNKEMIAQSLLNCRSIIFLGQEDLRNFVDYCSANYACQLLSKKGVMILKFYGKQIAIDSETLLLQPIVPEPLENEALSNRLQCIELFLTLVTVFTVTSQEHVWDFIRLVRDCHLTKGGKSKLFVLCEGFNPPKCDNILQSHHDPNFTIELLRIDDHRHTLEFLKRCDILIAQQNADISFNNLPTEFMIVNEKRALCLIDMYYNGEYRSQNLVKCDFTSTKEIERGINKLIDKLLLVTPPITQAELEKTISTNVWQSYEEIISAIQFMSSLMSNSQLVIIKHGLKTKTVATNEDCKLLKPDLLNRSARSQNRVIFISIDRLLKRDKKFVYTVDNEDADIYMLRIFKQNEFNHVLLETIEKLALATKANNVFVISSRSQYFLEKLFKAPMFLNLIAENGCMYKNAKSMTWHKISRADSTALEDCATYMEGYSYKFENAHIKRSEHYARLKLKDMDRKANSILLKMLYEELSKELENVDSHEVALYEKSVHVRPNGLNKGSLAQIVLQKIYIENGKIDFVIAFGRSESDEEMFAGIRRSQKICQEIFTPTHPICCKVGIRPSYANYFTRTKDELFALLTKLSE